MKTNNFYIYGSVVMSMLFWGMSFVWTAIVLETYPPITIIFLRLLISTAVLFLWLKIFGKFKKIKKEHYKLFLLSALFNPFFYFIGENYGVKLTSPTISAVIIATIPLVVPVFAWIWLKEKLGILNILGLLVSFVGIMIMLLDDNLSFEANPLGVAALIFAVISAVGFAILLKKLSSHYSPMLIIAVQNLLGLFFFLPIFLGFEFSNFLSIKPDVRVITSLLALAILCSSLAYIGFTLATREIGVSRTNIFANLIPVSTAIFSFLIIGEEINSQKILGIAIVILGLFFSQLKKNKSLFGIETHKI
ncbi:MAG: DMT family transporter [Bacteroidales bacterium]